MALDPVPSAASAGPDPLFSGTARANRMDWLGLIRGRALLLLGLAAMTVPTLIRLAQQIWTTEAGIHGPIVLATGLWLIARNHESIQAVRQPGRPAFAIPVMALGILIYVFGRAYDFISLEVVGLLAVLVATFYLELGGIATRRMWFPILYLGFLAPIPGWLIDVVTGPLKNWLSVAATNLLGAAGFPIAREGVTLYIAQYQLLVADACAGLNSLVSLTAISLFYIYLLHNASWLHAGALVLCIVPIAIAANLVRIIILVLVTYYLGDEAGQGFLHSTAGLVMFATALFGVFAVDKALILLSHAFRRRRSVA